MTIAGTGKIFGLGSVLAATLLLGITATGGAAVNVNGVLVGTTNAPRAKGHTKLVVKRRSKSRFAVVARHLAAHGTFDVIVGGVRVGALTTNAGGGGKVKFDAKPGHGSALLGFDPRGDQIVIRDDSGDDDLVGDEPPGDSASGACCLPGRHDGETECEDLSAQDCTNAGGTPSTAASCLPDPCTTTPPAEQTICCTGSAQGAFVEEDPEVECEDTSTPAECASRGGTVMTGTSCEPNPCLPTPPASDETACCVPHESETRCAMLTTESCAAHHGTAASTPSCDADPCGGGDGGMH